MRSLFTILTTSALSLGLAVATLAQPGESSGAAIVSNPSVPNAGDLYRRMLTVNAKLRTYTANVTLDIKMTSSGPKNPRTAN